PPDARPLGHAAGRLRPRRLGLRAPVPQRRGRASLMPISTFLGLETALRGVLAQQQALDVTGHNIANANTVGYTRQQAVMAATPALRYPPDGQIGTGVEVTQYRRVRDDFIDIQLRAQTMIQGYQQARQDGLQQVELATNEPGDNGISAQLDKFWSSWQDLSNNPEDGA